MKKLMDIHNHTTWSDGMHSAEEIIENAIENGVSIIGISDHFDTLKCHSVSPFKLEQYIHNLEKLKDKYKNRIEVRAGIEICMNKRWCEVDKLPYDALNKLDYVLFEYIDWFTDSVTLGEIKEYTNRVKCEKGLAHTNIFKLVEKYGIDYVVKALKENDLFWELNVNPGYEYFDDIVKDKNKLYVIELFNKFKEAGIKISVGSDTHSLYFYDYEKIKEGNKLAQYSLI